MFQAIKNGSKLLRMKLHLAYKTCLQVDWFGRIIRILGKFKSFGSFSLIWDEIAPLPCTSGISVVSQIRTCGPDASHKDEETP